jgi:glycosyltransferase involved in cell wall biosynthesis
VCVKRKPKILIALNTTWNLVNFRAGLIQALLASGFDVVAVAPPDDYVDRLVALGCRYQPLSMDNKGTNPFRDVVLFLNFLRLLRKERPDCLLGYTVKPNIYGSLAAHVLGTPVINNVSGLGTAFIRGGWMNRVVSRLYRVAFSRSAKVFFQNRDDLELFSECGLVDAERADRLPGSGVDLRRFEFRPLEQRNRTVFLMVARLLWDKGVGEYVAAARRVKQRYPFATFRLLGFLGAENRTAVPASVVQDWVSEGLIEYVGSADDVRPHLADADCVVLPSYREGAPRSLLEAAAMGRPIITTNVPGCRDVVDDGLNGFLCRPKDADDLADQMGRFLALPFEARQAMGRSGRRKMEREFDEQVVIDRYIAAIRGVISAREACILSRSS